jgi:hypothetical protein
MGIPLGLGEIKNGTGAGRPKVASPDGGKGEGGVKKGNNRAEGRRAAMLPGEGRTKAGIDGVAHPLLRGGTGLIIAWFLGVATGFHPLAKPLIIA